MKKTYKFGSSGIDEYMQDVRMELAKTRSLEEAHILAAPLFWFVNTGRAPTPWVKAMISVPIERISGSLAKGGSFEEAVMRMKNVVKVKGE